MLLLACRWAVSAKRPGRDIPVEASNTSAGPSSVLMRSASPRISGQPGGVPMERDNRAVTASLPAVSAQAIPLVPAPGCRSMVPVRATPTGWMGRSGRRTLRALKPAANTRPAAPLIGSFMPFPPCRIFPKPGSG